MVFFQIIVKFVIVFGLNNFDLEYIFISLIYFIFSISQQVLFRKSIIHLLILNGSFSRAFWFNLPLFRDFPPHNDAFWQIFSFYDAFYADLPVFYPHFSPIVWHFKHLSKYL